MKQKSSNKLQDNELNMWMSIKGGNQLVTIVISEVNNRYLRRIQNRRGCSKHEQVLKNALFSLTT